MGNIQRVLAETKLEPRSITPLGQWADLCENVHYHIRGVRLDFSQEEFARFRAGTNHLGMAIEKLAVDHDYEEGDETFCVVAQYNFPFMSPNSDYYANRGLIEIQRDGNNHVHYRDLRLDITRSEFCALANMFAVAVLKLRKVEAGAYDPPEWVREATKITEGTVPIHSVQPYDDGHRAGAMDEEHRAGIEYCKRLIEEGKRIRPIYISNKGQRLDGFKRYMAALELGRDEIEVIVDPFGVSDGTAWSGQQQGQSMLADEEEVTEDAVQKGEEG